MKTYPYLHYLILLPFFFLLATPVHAAKRIALVIGNGAYTSSPLKNPVNDATDMAALLKKLDFEVIKIINGNKRQMLQAMNRFSSRLKKSEVGLFYYAGHGMQINNRNYLIPVGINVLEESDVEYEAVDAGRIISKMKYADNKLNVVILDACRNNPFKRSFRSSVQGLARMDAPKGTIIAYATSPGSVAADGRGRNGIFTKHLLAAMAIPNLDLQNVFNEAGMGVMEETGDRQVPWTSNTPIPRFYLAGVDSEAGSRGIVTRIRKPEVRHDNKGYSGFAISSSTAAYGSDYNQVCVDEFGRNWGLADWSDLQKFYNRGGDLDKLVSAIGFSDKRNAWVTRNNRQKYSRSRDYFASFHGHRKPGGYLAHDNIDNYFFSLGSWYNSYYVLCTKD